MDLVFGLFSDSSWTAFGRLSECSRSCAWVAQNPLEVPLGTPWRRQNLPLEVPKSSQECPERVPRAPKSAQERQRASQERPKSVPRASQERPRAPKSAQERAKRAKLVARRVPEERQEAFQGTPERPRRPFWLSQTRKHRLSRRISGVIAREARSTRCSADFRSVGANAEMLKTCKNLWFS